MRLALGHHPEVEITTVFIHDGGVWIFLKFRGGDQCPLALATKNSAKGAEKERERSKGVHI